MTRSIRPSEAADATTAPRCPGTATASVLREGLHTSWEPILGHTKPSLLSGQGCEESRSVSISRLLWAGFVLYCA